MSTSETFGRNQVRPGAEQLREGEIILKSFPQKLVVMRGIEKLLTEVADLEDHHRAVALHPDEISAAKQLAKDIVQSDSELKAHYGERKMLAMGMPELISTEVLFSWMNSGTVFSLRARAYWHERKREEQEKSATEIKL